MEHALKSLKKTENPLVPPSYETTSNVLHNLRNTLNPVVREQDMIRQICSSMPVRQIERAIGELQKENLSPERRQKVNEFLLASLDLMKSLQQQIHQQLDNLERSTYMAEILMDKYEKSAGDRPDHYEEVNMKSLIREAISLNPAVSHGFADIPVYASIADGLTCIGNRTALLEIFSNLLINSYAAVSEAEVSPGEITFSCDEEIVQNKHYMHVRMYDNGIGIHPDNLERIFERGFSTKNSKSSGIGLYCCVKEVLELNGRIYAQSEGIGKGACMHVLIPKK